jgi:hypothetical protein
VSGGVKQVDDDLTECLVQMIKDGESLVLYPEQTLLVNFLSLDKLYLFERIFKISDE